MTDKIQLTNLKKSFGKENILNGVNLTIGEQEIVGLIGPSGAGKTTVIKTMLGMEKADSGKAVVLDAPMPNRKTLGKIGYMAQSDALYTTLSAYENLMFFGEMKSIPTHRLKTEINSVAELVNLSPDLNKKVGNFSGGMKRRLSLAIALLDSPPLLVLDEPTVGIDPALRVNIWQDLQNLRDHGTSILVTTHAMDEAELVDRVAMLIGGQIVACDTPASLKQKYQVDTVEKVFLAVEKEFEDKK